VASTSRSRSAGPAGAPALIRRNPIGGASRSASEPHVWHCGQRPAHFGVTCPHSAQWKELCGRLEPVEVRMAAR
jgi:hypothetical protein